MRSASTWRARATIKPRSAWIEGRTIADTEALKLVGAPWAETGDREEIETLGITRTVGYPVGYEQQGTGQFPERTGWNQKMREWDGAFGEMYRYGGLIPWDGEIDYYQWARVGGTDGEKYIAQVATGPAHGNAIDPTTDTANTVWRRH